MRLISKERQKKVLAASVAVISLVLLGTFLTVAAYRDYDANPRSGLDVLGIDGDSTIEPSLESLVKESASKNEELKQELKRDNQKRQLRPSEIEQINSWISERDYTEEHRAVYEAYSDEVIYRLAMDGDQYALEEGFQRKAREGEAELGLQMLHEAAALGSTSALIDAGYWAQSQLENIREYGASPKLVAKQFGLQSSDGSVEAELAQIAASYYIAAMLRGNVHMSSQYLEALQKDELGRRFTADEKAAIYRRARGLYDGLEASRAEKGMEAFDNQYPESYALFYGLPEQSVDLAKEIERLSYQESDP